MRLRAAAKMWCPRGDSNPHDLSRYHLKVVRLPIPPPGQFPRLRAERDAKPDYCKGCEWKDASFSFVEDRHRVDPDDSAATPAPAVRHDVIGRDEARPDSRHQPPFFSPAGAGAADGGGAVVDGAAVAGAG